MRFLVDAQLPSALALLLAERGHIAEHITDIGPGDAPDRDLWHYALDHQAVIVTKDEDFATWSPLAATRRLSCGYGSATPDGLRCSRGSNRSSSRSSPWSKQVTDSSSFADTAPTCIAAVDTRLDDAVSAASASRLMASLSLGR